jgi:uncharacterized protein involved in exopolysaccharide biosynthesis
VRLGRENVRLDATAALGQGPVIATPLSRECEINSVARIVASRAVIEKVVDQLGPGAVLHSTAAAGASFATPVPDQKIAWAASLLPSTGLSPRERAILKFEKKLDVEAVPRTNVIAVSYEAGSPELAQQAVDAVVQTYLDEHVRLNRTPRAHQFMLDQIARAQKELQQKEVELKRLRTETGVTDPHEQRSLLVQRMARLEDTLLEAEASVAAAEVEVANLEETLVGLSQTQVTSQTTGAGNEAIDRMREQLYLLQLQQEDLLSKYTSDHYKVRQIEEQIAQAKAILAEEEGRRTETILGPNAAYEQTRLELVRKRPVLAALRTKVSELKSQHTEVTADLETFNSHSLQVIALEREVSILEDNYRKYAHNLEQARIDESLEDEGITNITVAQPATLSAKPVRPVMLLNLFLGVVFSTLGGVSLAVVREYFDTRQPREEDPRRRGCVADRLPAHTTWEVAAT